MVYSLTVVAYTIFEPHREQRGSSLSERLNEQTKHMTKNNGTLSLDGLTSIRQAGVVLEYR